MVQVCSIILLHEPVTPWYSLVAHGNSDWYSVAVHGNYDWYSVAARGN